MNTISPRDVADAQALYTQLSRAPSTAPLRQMAAGNKDLLNLLDLHDALAARVSHGSQITDSVLTDAIKSAGLTVDDVRGKMGKCPMGGQPKAQLPHD